MSNRVVAVAALTVIGAFAVLVEAALGLVARSCAAPAGMVTTTVPVPVMPLIATL